MSYVNNNNIFANFLVNPVWYLQEIIGKYPPEYIRYLDLNEKPPKIKKRVGAEFKLKLRGKEGTSVVRFSIQIL